MKLDEIKGLGAKRIAALKESGITDVSDLLTVFPIDYVDLSTLKKPSACVNQGLIALSGTVVQAAKVKYIRKGLFLTTVVMSGDSGEEYECGWFNRKYMRNALKIGKQFFVYGKLERYGKKLSMSNPTLIPKTKDLPAIYPLYRSIKGIPSSVLISAIDTVLKNVRISSYLNVEKAAKYSLININDAFFCIHRPSSMQALEQAKRTVAVENLSCNIALYSILKQNGKKTHSYKDNRGKLSEFIKSLPFALSDDQAHALDDILDDLNSSEKMNRLLQGDVGCGKTIVALSAMLYAALSGFQSVLMSPTELLARQHYETARKLFADYNIDIEFLSSSVNAAERKTTLSRIENGFSLIVIGTHALIQDDVRFNNLSLIVTDEQQRFGVKQRGMLENKARNADYLVMTATPIPRTLALTLYGDLVQSQIHTLPRQKASITTRFVPQKKIDDMLKYVLEKAERGEQTYMVCPRIEDEELISANTLYSKLSTTSLKPYLGILHGQQSDAEKEEAMRKFALGEIRVLITTSIIEVGIDVPKATSIVIFNAERYGLSQLHQLRGRVGRGTLDSYCFLLSDNITSDKAKERLDYFIHCSDGFELAEFDFELRGAGDFLGTRQHGDSFLTSVNKPIIDISKEIASELSKDNEFKKRILDNTKEGQLLFIEKLTLN